MGLADRLVCRRCLPLLVDLGVLLFSLCGIGLGLGLLWALGFAILVLFGVGIRLHLAIAGRGLFFRATFWI